MMTGLDVFAALILLTTAGVLFAFVYFLGSWPGRVARSLNHPDAKAIEIGGWATLAFGGLFWPLILVWAYRTNGGSQHAPETLTQSTTRTASAHTKEQ